MTGQQSKARQPTQVGASQVRPIPPHSGSRNARHRPVRLVQFLLATILIVGTGAVCADEQIDPRKGGGKGVVAGKGSALPVIWSFSGWRDEPESLEHALRSKLITHVALFVGNRKTSDTLGKRQTREAIAMVKAARDPKVELILVRFLWETQPSRASELRVLSDVDYYVREIELSREEARRVGAQYVALDTETYGPTSLTTYFRSKKGFARKGYDDLVATVNEVVRRVGKVDFILPAGSARRNHPYTALAGLGKLRISEGTYYDNAKNIREIRYPYEIAGMYMNVMKKNERLPWKPYFLPREVFGDRANVWREKQGLMIWPRENRAGEVARLMEDFARQRGGQQDGQPRGVP